MKKFYLLSVLFFGLFSSFGQTPITLTFHAKDSLTQNTLVLDSVNVTNLTEVCDTTLYDAVSVLTIDALWPVGIGEPASPGAESFVVMQNVPNPFQGSTMVRIYLKNEGDLNLAVYDNQEKNLSQYHNSFQKGWHMFGVSTSGSQLLFLKVSDNSTTRTIKLLSTGAGGEGDRISYKGQTGQGSSMLKSFPAETGFIYYLGNQLRYTAYVEGYQESVMLDNPASSETYTFAMLEVVTLTTPTATTASVTNINPGNATSGGNVTSDGGSTVTTRGVCWSTSPNPTLWDSYTEDGAGVGTFISTLAGLTPNTPYYVRAYATNSIGTAYGNELTFTTTALTCGEVVSYDGQDYNTILIGAQCWFKENMNVGTMISTPAAPANNGIIEKYCYDNDPANCSIYGGLYTWNEMMQYTLTPGVQGICPSGWHLPTKDEYTMLISFLGGSDVAGGALKEAGEAHWNSPNTGATNSSGFTSLPAGEEEYGDMFVWLHTNNRIWTSSIVGGASHMFEMVYDSAGTEFWGVDRSCGSSVRCVKN